MLKLWCSAVVKCQFPGDLNQSKEKGGGVNIMLECLHLFVNTYICKIFELYFKAKVKNEGEINKKVFRMEINESLKMVEIKDYKDFFM